MGKSRPGIRWFRLFARITAVAVILVAVVSLGAILYRVHLHKSAGLPTEQADRFLADMAADNWSAAQGETVTNDAEGMASAATVYRNIWTAPKSRVSVDRYYHFYFTRHGILYLDATTILYKIRSADGKDHLLEITIDSRWKPTITSVHIDGDRIGGLGVIACD